VGSHTVYLVSVLLHILAAIAWIGGMIFLVVVVVPLIRRPEMKDQAGPLMHVLGLRFRTVGWVALGTLVVTGIVNVMHRGYAFGQILDGEVFAGDWGKRLAHKLALVASVLVLSGVHDFWIGPKATRLMRQGGHEAERDRLRKTASILGRVTFALALAIVAIAVSLVRG
jgi:uncharacterized membrane protein